MVESCPNCPSAGNAMRFGVKGEGAVDGAVDVTALVLCDGPAGAVSSLVIAKPLGTLLEPLDFLFFAVGPPEADGDV